MDRAVKHKPARLFYDSYTPEECDDSLSPVIFVHGLGGLHTSWKKVWKRIADQTRRKVFAVELRNHGKSEWNDDFALEALVTDIENFATENDMKECCLVGHSLGGKVSLLLGMMKPELVERLIVEEIAVRNPYQSDIDACKTMFNMAGKISSLPKTMSEKQVRTLLSTLASNTLPEWGISDAAYNLPLRRKSDGSIGFDFNFDVLNKFTADGSAFNINFQNCRKFSGPALFIFSKGSPTKLDEDMKLKEFFPNAKLQEFSRKVHVLHIECPDEYVETISMFLNH